MSLNWTIGCLNCLENGVQMPIHLVREAKKPYTKVSHNWWIHLCLYTHKRAPKSAWHCVLTCYILLCLLSTGLTYKPMEFLDLPVGQVFSMLRKKIECREKGKSIKSCRGTWRRSKTNKPPLFLCSRFKKAVVLQHGVVGINFERWVVATPTASTNLI